MTRAGRPVHFTTVARWQREGLLTTARSRNSLASIRGVRTAESAEPLAELPPPITSLEAKRVWDEQRRLPERVGPFTLQPSRGGDGGNGKWSRGSSIVPYFLVMMLRMMISGTINAGDIERHR
jgi:hypothetical protein